MTDQVSRPTPIPLPHTFPGIKTESSNQNLETKPVTRLKNNNKNSKSNMTVIFIGTATFITTSKQICIQPPNARVSVKGDTTLLTYVKGYDSSISSCMSLNLPTHVLTNSSSNCYGPRESLHSNSRHQRRDVTPVHPRLTLGQIVHKSLQLASPRIALDNFARNELLGSGAFLFLEVDGSEYGFIEVVVKQHHGHDVRVRGQGLR